MRGYMFRNRWLALLFVAMTLAGVTKLVGTDKEKGTIQQATSQIAAQKAQADLLTTTQTLSNKGDGTQDIPFASDEELIDPGVGEDPTPVDEFAAAKSAPDGPAEEVTIVSRDTPGEAAPAGPPAPGPAQVPAQ